MHALLCATQSLDPRSAERLRDDGVGTWLNRGLGLLAEAVVAGDRRRLVEADELAGRASADLATAPTMAAIAMAYAAPHALASGWGAPRDWLNAAREQFVLLGNELMRRHCESIMQQGGIPVPRRGRGDAQVPPRLRALGVTSREMDVLLLVAENLTNAEIAARLSISLRTVDTHVSRLLTKTDRTRRGQLLAFVRPE
jgi:DNA-binding CsgD family transcriptional regulator